MIIKNRYQPYFLSITLLSALALLLTQKEVSDLPDKKTAAVSLIFNHRIGSGTFSPDSVYVNDFGETFTVNRFKYYISNIQWRERNSGKIYSSPQGYFLVDEAEPLSKKIEMKIPPGNYTSVSFIVGVDSLKNVSGAQDGALDPINGMFWTWQTGYIMAKLEGTSPVSKLPRKMFEFHIGGFKGPYNVLKPVEISIPGEHSAIQENKINTVHISVDINKWFNGKHPLPLSQHTACMTPGKLAFQYAENYLTMFSADTQKPE